MLARLCLFIPNHHIDVLIIPQSLQELRVRAVRGPHLEELIHALERDTLCLWDEEETMGMLVHCKFSVCAVKRLKAEDEERSGLTQKVSTTT